MFGRGPRKLLSALVWALCCAALVPTLADAAELGSIGGAVTEAGTEAPIGGAEVCASRPDGEAGGGCVFADENGEYAIEELPEGEYEVRFPGEACPASGCVREWSEQLWKDRHANETPDLVEVEEGNRTPEIDAALEAFGAISGTISEAGGGPITGAVICVDGANGLYFNSCVPTAADGGYEFVNLPPGEFNVEFTGWVCETGVDCTREECEEGKSCTRPYIAQYYLENPIFNPEELQTVTVTSRQTEPGVDAALVPGGRITGTVTLAGLAAEPLAGITVCAMNEKQVAETRCAATGPDGEYVLEGLPSSASWQVRFSETCAEEPCPEIYVPQRWNGRPDEEENGDEIELTAPGEVTEIDAAMVEKTPRTPSFVTKPELTGNPFVGETLSCSEGTWANNPTAIRYAWLRTGVPITGAEGTTYTPTAEDQGEVITCEVEISNSAGSIEALSNNVIIRGEEAPAFTTAPVLSGTPAVGQTLTCSEGTSVNGPTSTTFQWVRDGAPVAGQGGGTYVVTSADEGTSLACVVTIANGAGSASATSNALAVPPHQEEGKAPSSSTTTPPASSTPPPATTSPAPEPGTATSGGVTNTKSSVTVTLKCPAGQGACNGSPKLVYEEKTKSSKGKTKVKKVTISKAASFSISPGKSKKVTLKLTSKGKKLVKEAGKKGVKVKLAGSGVKPKTLTLHHP